MRAPAFCGQCGACFLAHLPFDVGRATLTGNMTDCPVCGGAAPILDGTYEFTQEIINVVAAPEFTLEVLRRVATIINATKLGIYTVDEAVDELKEASPSLYKTLMRLATNDAFIGSIVGGFFVLLAAIIQPIIEAKFNDQTDEEAIVERVLRSLDLTPSAQFALQEEQASYEDESIPVPKSKPKPPATTHGRKGKKAKLTRPAEPDKK